MENNLNGIVKGMESVMVQFITSLAVRWLTWQLRKDKDFWRSYQSNIAMCIYDNLGRNLPLTTEKSSPTLLELSNICANDFMYLWTRKI